MADLINMLPALDSASLANLLANAERLSRDGSDKQRVAAAVMLTAVRAECTTRGEAKRATNAAAKSTRPRRAALKLVPQADDS